MSTNQLWMLCWICIFKSNNVKFILKLPRHSSSLPASMCVLSHFVEPTLSHSSSLYLSLPPSFLFISLSLSLLPPLLSQPLVSSALSPRLMSLCGVTEVNVLNCPIQVTLTNTARFTWDSTQPTLSASSRQQGKSGHAILQVNSPPITESQLHNKLRCVNCKTT